MAKDIDDVREFEKFTDFLNYRKACPICSKTLKCKITYSTDNKQSKWNSAFNSLFKNKESDDKKIEFDLDTNELNLNDLEIVLKFNENIAIIKDISLVASSLNFEVYCEHDIIGNVYLASGKLGFGCNLFEYNNAEKEDDKFKVLLSLFIDYEKYTIYNIHLEDEKPNGNLIKIINDYQINKTSFCIAETNLDGSFGTWKEKRIDLVKDEFFNFSNTEKIYSRINTIFLLQ